MLELELVRCFRAGKRATVDEFHAFLLSLGGQAHGRFWALVACLLSVQCRDVVALEAIKALLPGSDAPTVAQIAGREDVVALHAVCRERVFWETLEALEKEGARAILVLPIEKMLA